MSLSQRFWDKVWKAQDGCWLWTACVLGIGYGKFGVGGESLLAHRLAYEDAKGSIPDGHEIDHLCQQRSCVNPAHLEAVTHAENCRRGAGFGGVNARKTHCKWGHPFDGGNTYRTHSGKRHCRTCDRLRHRRYREVSS